MNEVDVGEPMPVGRLIKRSNQEASEEEQHCDIKWEHHICNLHICRDSCHSISKGCTEDTP